MQQFELGNFLKNKQQLEQKLAAIDRLKDKLTSMGNKMTHRGYQKVNTVMLRNVEIKHTSEFMIKLNKEYFAQVKTQTALQNLDRKKINYEEQLKKVDYKIQLLEKKIKKAENKERDNDFLNKHDKSTVEVIGTNEEGESVFNIIEVEGQGDDDVGEWKEKGNNDIQQKNINKEQRKVQQPQNQPLKKQQLKPITNQQAPTPQPISKKQQQPIPYQIEGDQDILFGNDSQQDQAELSDIDEDQQEEHQKQTEKKVIVQSKEMKEQKKVAQKKIQTQQKGHQHEKKESIVKVKQSQAGKSAQKLTALTAQKAPVQKKPTTAQKPKQVEPPKPISKFKLERMKQKLQQNL